LEATARNRLLLGRRQSIVTLRCGFVVLAGCRDCCVWWPVAWWERADRLRPVHLLTDRLGSHAGPQRPGDTSGGARRSRLRPGRPAWHAAVAAARMEGPVDRDRPAVRADLGVVLSAGGLQRTGAAGGVVPERRGRRLPPGRTATSAGTGRRQGRADQRCPRLRGPGRPPCRASGPPLARGGDDRGWRRGTPRSVDAGVVGAAGGGPDLLPSRRPGRLAHRPLRRGDRAGPRRLAASLAGPG
jgi:hypothetical protein